MRKKGHPQWVPLRMAHGIGYAVAMRDTRRVRLRDFTISAGFQQWRMDVGTLYVVRERIHVGDGSTVSGTDSWRIKVSVPSDLLRGDHGDLLFRGAKYSGAVFVSGEGCDGRGKLLGFSW